jgi:CDP-glucose 4,6-dehydratase
LEELFNSIYNNKKVLITGHTGFKGSWLALWLSKLGAKVLGYSDKVPTSPSHFHLLNLPYVSIYGDIRDKVKLFDTIQTFQPEIIFHLAAQPLVRFSYNNPIETFETNILGTANILEAARNCKSVQAIVNITSDKAYENTELDIAYKETDRMGGYDPYSASKGAAELVVSSYRNSFFNLKDYGVTHQILLASARAGNVIGGGDWAEDRLIPDIVKASIDNKPVSIRHPNATRPWQHVLEPLSGYLLLGKLLLQGKKEFADGWNFGPTNYETLKVEEVLLQMKNIWTDLHYIVERNAILLHEANLLRLDCTKANTNLNWFPVWTMEKTIEKTAFWYKQFYNDQNIITVEQLDEYVDDAKKNSIVWSK